MTFSKPVSTVDSTPVKKRKVTVVEVAEAAGVSVSAVSRAFNPEASISRPLREKVFKAAASLNYKPNRLARGIKSRSSLVGILMTDFNNPFYLPILNSFTTEIQRRNCHSLLINVNSDMDIQEAVELVMEYNVDGLIITSASLPEQLVEACKSQDTPVVIFGRDSHENSVTVVSCDNVLAGRMAADMLLDAGYDRPAFVAGPIGTSATVDRQRGFISRLMERGCNQWQVVEGGEFSYDAGYDATLRIFKGTERPDAMFYADDIMACGGMDALRYELNVKIPDDVGVIGVDDIRLAKSRSYDLSTIRQPNDQMILSSIDALFQHIADPNLPAQSITLPCEPVVRGSTKKGR
ncbi:LacI family DNA-binding transcriptional regulator [Enterovibrio makurazakiensis]|uniref:LacI family DNA-binding transcriptional regulator n=1 Tax=Enterovibrio gelatinilyticus TaxID=2899819 RepID=A0ABT5R721_9GAMM|nr:LacI family DNA-binding transcriptional regulator [Enterovibrio sp. ZSDZ42]MDD1796073.1 LacI family DNA-binding transcriptional regulator [Enterovibrio sp. ZSDZ42]